MPIAVSCPQCQSRFAAREDMVGTQVSCPNCKGPIQVTAAGSAAPQPAAPAAITCPDCGKQYAYQAKFAGKTLPCASCGGMIDVPAAGGSAPAPAPSMASAPMPGVQQAIVCPDCGTRFAYRAELIGKTLPCGACGTSFTAGEEAKPDYTFASDDPLGGGGLLDDDPLGIPSSPAGGGGTATAAPPRKKKKKKKKKKKGLNLNFDMPEWLKDPKMKMAVGGGAAGFAVLLGIILLVVFWPSDPHRAVLNDGLALIEDLAVAFESVKDEESAKKAAAEIDRIVTKLIDVEKRMNEIPTTPEKEEEVKKEFQERVKPLAERIEKAVQSAIQVPGAQDHLLPVFTKMSSLNLK